MLLCYGARGASFAARPPPPEIRLSAHVPPDQDPERDRSKSKPPAQDRTGSDFGRFLQKRKLTAYEEGMARLAYAYGVDLRRARWLTASSVGNTLVRAVDRRWPVLSRDLVEGGELGPADGVPVGLLREIADCMELLRAPLPVLRVVGTPKADATSEPPTSWPLAIGLGPTHGDVNWLVLDVDGLAGLDPGQRAFFLGSALADLQCDHGVFVTAHLLASRREGDLSSRLLRAALRPWSQVMAFSADRAGLLCASSLEVAIAAMERQHAMRAEPQLSWLPPGPRLEARRRALTEFDKTKIVSRVRAARARANGRVISIGANPPATGGPSDGELGVPDDAWSLARVDTRLTRRLGLF